jgi:hypothetical protein
MKKFLCFFIFIFSLHSVNAGDVKFGWSVGNIGIDYNFLNNNSNARIELLRFNWLMNNNIGIGFSLFEMQDTNNKFAVKYSLLPMEISYSLMNYREFIYFSLYSKLGWQFRQSSDSVNNNFFYSFFAPTNGFYGAIGARLFLFPDFKFHYSWYTSVFFEYTIFNELRIGISVDAGALIIGTLWAWKEGIEKARANEWEKKPEFDNNDRRDKPR